MAAGLLFVFAFGVGFAANGFAVGDFGRMHDQFDVVALAELGDDDFDVLLPGAAEQKFLGLRIAGEAQGQIFLQNFVNGETDAVFIGAGFGFDGESDGGFGNARGRMKDRSALVTQSFAGGGVFQFGDAANVSGVEFGDFVAGFSLHGLDVLEAFG